MSSLLEGLPLVCNHDTQFKGEAIPLEVQFHHQRQIFTNDLEVEGVCQESLGGPTTTTIIYTIGITVI